MTARTFTVHSQYLKKFPVRFKFGPCFFFLTTSFSFENADSLSASKKKKTIPYSTFRKVQQSSHLLEMTDGRSHCSGFIQQHFTQQSAASYKADVFIGGIILKTLKIALSMRLSNFSYWLTKCFHQRKHLSSVHTIDRWTMTMIIDPKSKAPMKSRMRST